jgi:putative ABC transport system substrate-binding protein
MRRREFIAGVAGAATWPVVAGAQHDGRVRRIGALIGVAEDDPLTQSFIAAFRDGLAKFGWAEHGNLQIDYRFSGDPRRLAAHAEELVSLRPDLIFAFTGPAAWAVHQRTSAIPIVFVGGGDPAANGLVGSVARPAGNVTGFANIFASLGGKWLELFKGAVPRLTRVAHVFSTIDFGDVRGSVDAAAVRLGVKIVRMPVSNAIEIEPAISAFAAESDGGLLVTAGGIMVHLEAIERLALQYRLPLMFGGTPRVEEGTLMSHGPDVADLARRAPSYVDRILRGAKPSDLPVQFPTKFELAVNLKTAKAIGVTIPEAFLLGADRVIE